MVLRYFQGTLEKVLYMKGTIKLCLQGCNVCRSIKCNTCFHGAS